MILQNVGTVSTDKLTWRYKSVTNIDSHSWCSLHFQLQKVFRHSEQVFVVKREMMKQLTK
jgi:hypothetical protein